MASTNLQSVIVKKESTFGSLVNNFPDKTIFNAGAAAIPVDISTISSPGEAVINENNQVRNDFFLMPPDVATTYDSDGNPIHRRRGQLTLTVNGIQSIGPTTNSDNYWLMWCLGSMLYDHGKPRAASEAAVDVDPTNTVQSADDTDYDIGQIISAMISGQAVEYAAIVTKPGSDVLEVNPAFSATSAETIYLSRVFAVNSTNVGASLAFRIDGEKWRTYAWGCRMTALNLSGTEGRVNAEMVFDCALFHDDHDTVTAGDNMVDTGATAYTSGKVLHALDSGLVISNVIDPTDGDYPVIPGRNVPDVDEWSINISRVMSPCRYTWSILGMSGMEPGQVTCEVTFSTCSESLTYDNDQLRKSQRHLVFGFGPGGLGEGMAVDLPGAFHFPDPALRDQSGELVMQSHTFRQGRWTGDTGSRADNTLVDTPLRIAFIDSVTA